jgi:hypothetical protein
VVNDIAYRFWNCSKCMAIDHQVEKCMNKIRCRGCYRYGHKERNCINKFVKNPGRWVPKRVGLEISTSSMPIITLAGSASSTRQNPLPPPPLSQNEVPPPLPRYETLIRPFCITILNHNLLLFIDIFHI